ncbi:MAG: aspartyl protease family protein [Candidatus Eremiobacteraeota bacterium]|nr:aspartyl protease family protein [Candidatus Eremiobacteraeota bacterium]
MRLLILVAVFLTFAAGAPAQSALNTDPPLGIVPTTLKLQTILQLNQKAVGTSNSTQHVRLENWEVTAGGLSGTLVRLESGGDYREDRTFGPFHTAQGSYRGVAWQQDEDGLTVVTTGIHRRDTVDLAALEHAPNPDSGVWLLGLDPSENAYVVKVAPTGGRIEYLFFDKDTHLVVRAERAFEDQRVVTTYDDFRATNGETIAWHRASADGRPFNDEDYRLQALAYLASVDPARFQAPPSDRSHLEMSAARVQLPVKVLADRIIVMGRINGRSVDFQLDSGASEILLNNAVANALQLPEYGQQTQVTAGTYTARHSIVQRVDFGGATLTNVAVTTAPFHTWADETTPVAGLLGFGFIANCVVHVDYVQGRVEAIDPASFEPPSGAIALSIRLDDQVPVITVKIGTATSDRFILDTGADRSTLFSAFVQAHPLETADQGLGQQYTEAYPYFDKVSGVGGSVSVTRTQVSSLAIGTTVFNRWLFSVVHEAPSFEGEDYDGLIGQDVLRNFDVYLDYPHSKIYLVPNDRYRQRYG